VWLCYKAVDIDDEVPCPHLGRDVRHGVLEDLADARGGHDMAHGVGDVAWLKIDVHLRDQGRRSHLHAGRTGGHRSGGGRGGRGNRGRWRSEDRACGRPGELHRERVLCEGVDGAGVERHDEAVGVACVPVEEKEALCVYC
jgi:hypothetical protein